MRHTTQIGLLSGLFAIALTVLSGCGGGSEWKVVIENKNAEACAVDITMRADGSSKASHPGVKPGETVTLIAGSDNTVVNTVKVTRGTDVKTITPMTPLTPGLQSTITISADGSVTAATPK